MSDNTIFHNPACGTSRNVLAMIRNSGVEPTIVNYLQTLHGRARLAELAAAMGIAVSPVNAALPDGLPNIDASLFNRPIGARPRKRRERPASWWPAAWR
jgi:hypothetical protein